MSSRHIEIDYINHRGERSIRHIDPSYLWWGSTQWHPRAQWHLHAWDLDKGKERDFAWAGIQGTGGIREAIAARTPVSEQEETAPPVLLSRKRVFNADGWSRVHTFYEWMQTKGQTEALQEFLDLGLLDAAMWMPDESKERR